VSGVAHDDPVIRSLLALAALAVAGFVLVTRWSVVLAGHPAYLVLLVALAVTGAVLGLRARRERPGGTARRVGRVTGALLLVLVLAATVWLRPYAATEPVATADSTGVDVVETATTWELVPRAAPAATGLVFLPGALVDPRAYLPLLRPAAEAGHVVVLVKPPLDLALLSPPPLGPRPGVTRWLVGGHSLGGAAATFAADDPRVAGLVLWAAYPNSDLSGSDLPVLSVSGDRDGLATPADIDAARPLLPPDTRYVVVPGGNHAFFGDYGAQAGDGEAAVPREEAQRTIVRATVDFLDEQ
jgi:hypothetical protein